MKRTKLAQALMLIVLAALIPACQESQPTAPAGSLTPPIESVTPVQTAADPAYTGNFQTVTPEPSITPKPTFWSTKRVIPIQTATDPFEYTDGSKDGYLSKIPLTVLENETGEEIVEALLTRYLEHYLSDCETTKYCLNSYEVEEVSLVELIPFYAPWRDNYEMIARVTYMVNPVDLSGWNGATSESLENGLVVVHSVVGVFINGEDYQLRWMPGFGT